MNQIGRDLRPVLRCIAQSGSARDAFDRICRIAMQQGNFCGVGIACNERSNGQPTWIAEATDDRDSDCAEAARIAIVCNGSTWGFLSAFRSRDHESSDEDMEFLEDICFVIGLALESRRLAHDDHSVPQDGFISQAATALADLHSLQSGSRPEHSKSEFLATVAHELRSPLTPVIGFTGMMLQRLPGPLTPEQQHQLEMIRTSGRRLLDLIKNILDLAKLALGQTGVQTSRFDLNETVRSVATRAEPLAAEKGIVLQYEVPQSPTFLVSDRRLIGQLISEILGNAIKFTERGQVKLTACTRQGIRACEAEAMFFTDYACIEIADTGIGIASSAMPRLFAAFGHAGYGKTHQNEGSRLGLAVCKGLIDLLRGRIYVDSHPDEGSIFTIHLPMQWQGRMT